MEANPYRDEVVQPTEQREAEIVAEIARLTVQLEYLQGLLGEPRE